MKSTCVVGSSFIWLWKNVFPKLSIRIAHKIENYAICKRKSLKFNFKMILLHFETVWGSRKTDSSKVSVPFRNNSQMT